MKFKKTIIYPILLSAGFLLFVHFSEYREASFLIDKYGDSESAVRLLKTKDTFHLYRRLHKREPMISPVDLALALKDAETLFDSEDLILPLARIRHLLGASYPTDFAVALARTESELPETDAEKNVPPASPDEDQTAFFNEIVTLAIQAYFPPDQVKNDAYSVIDHAADENGFSATAFKDDKNHIVIAVRGSDEAKDLADAQRIVDGQMPAQFAPLDAFYEKLRKQYPEAKIRATGHSLGGSLSQLLAAYHQDVMALTCNPMGTKRLIKDDVADENILNLTVEGDKFSSAFPQIGHTLVLKAERTDKYGDVLHPHSVLNCLKD